MLGREKQQVEAYERVQLFMTEHPAPAGMSYERPRVVLNEVVTRLSGHSVDQAGGGRLSRAERQREKVLQRSVRALLNPISTIAKAELAQSPGIENALKMPKPGIGTTALIAEARAMREAVSQYSATFVDNGMPANFLEELDAAIEELRSAVIGKARNVGTKAGARAGIAQEVKRGRSAIQKLDAIVRTAFRGQKDVLAKWRVAKRVRALPGGGIPATGGTADENLAPATAQEVA